jgi:hypothetical protein
MTGYVIQLTIWGVTVKRQTSPAQYIKDLLERTKACRIASTLSRDDVVQQLSDRTGQKVKMEAYKKWETRTPIPHFYLIAFCEIVGADPWFLLTGKPFKLGKHQSSGLTGKDPNRSAA